MSEQHNRPVAYNPADFDRTVYVRYSCEPVTRTLDADTDQSGAKIRVDLDVDGQLVGVRLSGGVISVMESRKKRAP